MTIYKRERTLARIVGANLIEALGSPDLMVRAGAIDELERLAIAEGQRLDRGCWAAAAPITEIELWKAWRTERELFVQDTIWRQAHEGQPGNHFRAAATV